MDVIVQYIIIKNTRIPLNNAIIWSFSLNAGESDDFCASLPQTKMVRLPLGCQSREGAGVYDVGTCNQQPCRRGTVNDTISCQDEVTFCCGPTSFSRVDLVCEEETDFIFVVSTDQINILWKTILH